MFCVEGLQGAELLRVGIGMFGAFAHCLTCYPWLLACRRRVSWREDSSFLGAAGVVGGAARSQAAAPVPSLRSTAEAAACNYGTRWRQHPVLLRLSREQAGWEAAARHVHLEP